jgi:integrase/recombinase XerD
MEMVLDRSHFRTKISNFKKVDYKMASGRESCNGGNSKALFTNSTGGRLNRNGVYTAVTEAAERAGIHSPNSDRMENRFSPHCCRHRFVTHLLRAGMSRDYVKELRGDTRGEAIDIYNHIDRKELRESYLAHLPHLGVI